MINDKNTEYLRIAVVAGRETCRGYCALARLAYSIDATPRIGRGLDFIAAGFGFSVHEAKGIMDGWDTTVSTRKRGVFYSVYYGDRYHTPSVTEVEIAEYEAGKALGREMAEKYQ